MKLSISTIFVITTSFIFIGYSYRPEGKPDPFSPISLMRPTFSGTTRLQQHEISEFELVGTLFGKEITALLMTPEPKEGIVVRVGDRIGRNGGRIVSIARDRILTREQSSNSIPGQNIQFTDIVIPLSKIAVTKPTSRAVVDPFADYNKNLNEKK